MKRFTQRMSLILAAALMVPAVSQAGFRAYLSANGVDNPSCGVSNPCRLLPAALAAVSSGGEVWMLDSANFNTTSVTVNQNVIIQAIPGQVGSIAPVGGAPAMVISPGVSVTLRNISMVTNPVSPGTDGIQMTTGSLTVDNSVFEVWGTSYASPNGNAILVNGAGTVTVNNSMFRHGFRGIYALGGAIVSVSNSKFTNLSSPGASNGGCIMVEASVASTTTRLTVSHTSMSDSYTGVWVRSTLAGSSGIASINGLTASNNLVAVASMVTGAGAATVSITNSTVTDNQLFGLYQNTGAVLETQSNNWVRNNGTNTTGVISPLSGT